MSGGAVRVARLQALGGPEVLRLDRLPCPEPGPGEVRVRTAAIGLNRVEAMYRAGLFGAPALPARIGYEAVGTVEALGEKVTTVACGDRVATIPGLDMQRYGTHAEAFLYPADMLVVLSKGQPFDEAAASWMALLTAYRLAEIRLLKPGAVALLTAASSSVGLAAIQIVRREGAVPVAITRTRAKADELRRLGAEHVISLADDDLPGRVSEITAGRGAQVAFDAVTGATLARLAEAMAPGGLISIYGTLDVVQTAMPLEMMMMKGLQVQGFSANQITLDPARLAPAIDYIRSGLESGALSPVIARRFSFDQIADAHRYLESNQQVGKVVVTVD